VRDKPTPVIGFKTTFEGVYHLPTTIFKGVPSFQSLCYRDLSSAPMPGLKFEDINNPNICRHCAFEFRRRGAENA
jgi:hypothetical protein